MADSIVRSRVQLREFLCTACNQKGHAAVIDAIIDQLGVPALMKLCRTVSVTTGVELCDSVIVALEQTAQIGTIEATDIVAEARRARPDLPPRCGEILGNSFAIWHKRRQEGKYDA